jgi:hypothetical protein
MTDVDFLSLSIEGSLLTIGFIPDLFGSGTVTITASDNSSRLSVDMSFSVTVSQVNDVPIASGDTVQVLEDTAVEVLLVATDADGDSLVFSLDSTTLYGSVVLNGSVLTYTPNLDYFGEDSFDFRVSDGSGFESTATVHLEIQSVNDLPDLSEVTAVSFDEDTETTIMLSGTDSDGDTLLYSISEGVNINAVLDGNQATFVGSEVNYNGSEAFVLSVTDGEAIVTQNLSVTILPVNDSPELNFIDHYVIYEESVSDVLVLTGTDVDGDDLFYSISGGVFITATLIDDGVTFLSDLDFNGQETFTVTVSDEFGGSDSQDFVVDVGSVNDGPILSLQDQTMNEDDTLVLSMNALDVDSTILTYSATTTNGIVTVNGSTLTLQPLENFVGEVTVTVIVSDGEFFDEENFVVSVLPINDAPEIGSTLTTKFSSSNNSPSETITVTVTSPTKFSRGCKVNVEPLTVTIPFVVVALYVKIVESTSNAFILNTNVSSSFIV